MVSQKCGATRPQQKEATLANERDNTTPPCMRYMGKVIDDLVGTTVDLTCLADYDLDMIDAVEAFAAHEAYKTHYLKGDGT